MQPRGRDQTESLTKIVDRINEALRKGDADKVLDGYFELGLLCRKMDNSQMSMYYGKRTVSAMPPLEITKLISIAASETTGNKERDDYYSAINDGIHYHKFMMGPDKFMRGLDEKETDKEKLIEIRKQLDNQLSELVGQIRKMNDDLVGYRNHLVEDIGKLASKLPPAVLYFYKESDPSLTWTNYHLHENDKRPIDPKKVIEAYNKTGFLNQAFGNPVDNSQAYFKHNTQYVDERFNLLSYREACSEEKHPELYGALKKLKITDRMLAVLQDESKTCVVRLQETADIANDEETIKVLKAYRGSPKFWKSRGEQTLNKVQEQVKKSGPGLK